MSVFCAAYAMQFAFPVFTHDDTFALAGSEVNYLTQGQVVAALMMAIVGVVAVQAGYYWFLKSGRRMGAPIAQLHLRKSRALAYCTAVGFFVPLLFTFQGIIPEEFQQPLSSILRLLQNQVLVVIGILGWLYYGRKESKAYGVWLYGLVLILVLRGVSSGSLEQTLIPIGMLFVVKWLYTRRVPIAPILVTAALIVFLSPVKSDYRRQAWLGEDPDLAEQSSLTKGTLWMTQAADYWTDTLAGGRDLSEATSSAAGRTDLIHQVAHIYSMTPSSVPYQYGTTYSYFAVALIPRVLWPDKPVAGNANNFYATTYGVTDEEGLKGTTFGVSLLGESFINFGWFGVIFVMLFQGLVLGLLQFSFGETRSGPGGQAVFLAFFVFFLNGIGSSAEILFGNILQNVLCSYVLLLWATETNPRLLGSRFPFVRRNPAQITRSSV
jgi:predicted small integral membrane protein